MKTYTAAAFDMDGLMFDTEDVYWKAADALLKRRGFAYTRELCSQIMGRPPEFCFTLLKERFALPERWQDLHAESEVLFLEILKDGFSMMPGLIELLEHLERRKIPKAVCTSSAVRVAREVLGNYDMMPRFQFVLTAENITRGKPDPQIFQKAAEQFKVEPSDMVVFEDSMAGIAAAAAAGAFAVAVLAEHNRDNDYSNASLVVNRLDDERVLKLF
ncbi:MAG: HAD family phosphatase [Planctomycetaceae bacterium]|jgi:HAD superfamily hydrolase (TIGR01509 family)|nr:HAD family phosphatase [Planctomycetaceae bacterium]